MGRTIFIDMSDKELGCNFTMLLEGPKEKRKEAASVIKSLYSSPNGRERLHIYVGKDGVSDFYFAPCDNIWFSEQFKVHMRFDPALVRTDIMALPPEFIDQVADMAEKELEKILRPCLGFLDSLDVLSRIGLVNPIPLEKAS